MEVSPPSSLRKGFGGFRHYTVTTVYPLAMTTELASNNSSTLSIVAGLHQIYCRGGKWTSLKTIIFVSIVAHPHVFQGNINSAKNNHKLRKRSMCSNFVVIVVYYFVAHNCYINSKQ